MPNWKKVIVSGSDANLNSLYAPSITGSLFGTASYATLALTASYFSGSISTAISSSYATQATSASYALLATSASYAPTFPYTGNVVISGSFTVWTGSMILSTSQSGVLFNQILSQSAANLATGSSIFAVNITPTFWNTTSSQTQTALRILATFTGSASGSNTTNKIVDFGSTTAGSQLTVTDQISGSIYMVNDVSGLPIIEARSDWTVNLWNYPNIVFQKTGSNIIITGSLKVSGSITGSLFGTASYATLALTASYFSGSISTAISSSYATQATSASYALTASYALFAVNGGGGGGGSVITSGSFTGSFSGSFTGSLVGTASYASTASYAMNIPSVIGNLIDISDAGVWQGQAAYLDFTGAGVTASVAGLTASINIPGGGGGGGGATLNYFNPQDAYLQVATQIGQGNLMFQPMQVPDVAFDRVVIPINYSNASNSSNSFTVSMWVGTYTRNVSTLSLLSSISTSYNITNSGTVGSYSLYAGMRLLSIPMGATNTLEQGQYYVGMVSRTTTGGGAGMTMSNMVISQINSSFSGIFGQASAVTIQYTRGLGMYSATTNAMPATVGFNQLTGNSSQYLRQPAFYIVNGTV